ncbi:HERC1, partial [Symbiodinium sp. CCMP2592]
KPLPDNAKYIPDNCVICSRECGGVVKLGDGDYDGDFIQISAWVELLEFMENTPSETDLPALRQAREKILTSLPKRTPSPLTSIGLACAMAERAQDAAYKSLDPAGDGSLLLAAKLAQVAHMAYDVPKKYDAAQVLELGRQLLSDAGIGCQAPRCTSGIVEMLQLERVNPIPLLPSPADFPGRQAIAGMVWYPYQEVKLSARAGAVLRRCLLQQKPVDDLDIVAKRVLLEAIGGIIAHRLAHTAGPMLEHVKAGNAEPLIAAASCERRLKAITTWSYLLDCQLRY